MQGIKRFINLSLSEKFLFLEAMCFLFLAKLMLLVMPFSICIRTVKEHKYGDNKSIDKIIAVKLAITRANRLASWKNVCLVQSFAGRWMLQRREINSTLRIGIRNGNGTKLIAHAWLTAFEHEIVPQGGDYILLKTF